MQPDYRTLVQLVVQGHANVVGHLQNVSWDRLQRDLAGVRLLVTRNAVARVLQSLGRHEISDTQAQQWASFVRRGYALGAVKKDTAVRPLVIDYETECEDAIVEVISRLDEIGDVIDGRVPDKVEIEIYLASLGLAPFVEDGEHIDGHGGQFFVPATELNPLLVSDAIVLFTGKSLNPFPVRSVERLQERYDPSVASDVASEVARLDDEFHEIEPADDESLEAAADRAADVFAARHPRLTPEAVGALRWCYTYDWK